MKKKSLHEVLKRHKPKAAKKSPARAKKSPSSKKPTKKQKEKLKVVLSSIKKPDNKKEIVEISEQLDSLKKDTESVVLSIDDAKKLFFDLPRDHKFWLASGNELNNLAELYAELQIMSDDVFYHHVNDNKNDFAEWIKNILCDSVLAEKLFKTKTRHDFIKVLGSEIQKMKISSSHDDKQKYLEPNFSFIHMEKKEIEDHGHEEHERVTTTKDGFVLKSRPLQADQDTLKLLKGLKPHGLKEIFSKEASKHIPVNKDGQVLHEIRSLREEVEGFDSVLKKLMVSQRLEDRDLLMRAEEKRSLEIKNELKKLEEHERELEVKRREIAMIEDEIAKKEEEVAKKEGSLIKKKKILQEKLKLEDLEEKDGKFEESCQKTLDKEIKSTEKSLNKRDFDKAHEHVEKIKYILENPVLGDEFKHPYLMKLFDFTSRLIDASSDPKGKSPKKRKWF